MKADFAFICDYAEATGKINALGIGFDNIYAAKLPFKYPHFSLVVQLRASSVESGQKTIKVNLIDEDGKDVLPTLTNQVNIPKPESGTSSIARFVIEFGNVEFKHHGAYSICMAVDGMELAVIDFNISPPPSGSR